MTEPRRVVITWDYGASGIWWVLNDDWDHRDTDSRALQERGRDLAMRVQDELGTDGWEVLYQMNGQMLRVHPPGSWPIGAWEQQLLGYAPRGDRSTRTS